MPDESGTSGIRGSEMRLLALFFFCYGIKVRFSLDSKRDVSFVCLLLFLFLDLKVDWLWENLEIFD